MLSGLLLEYVSDGIVEKHEIGSPEVWLEVYLQNDIQVKQILERLRAEPMIDACQVTVEEVHQEDWIEQWRRQHAPLLLAERVFIRPPWDDSEPPPGAFPLILEPGMAFGTGRHETTQLCLGGLIDHIKPGMQVLDLGCGSGILAFAAAILGAASVLALDHDPTAIRIARQNQQLNELPTSVQIECGSLSNLRHSPRHFDLILVNITTPIICQLLAEDLISYLRPAGRVLFSGILISELEQLTAHLPTHGFSLSAKRTLGEWAYIEAIAQHDIVN